ncbi:MAG: ferritin-like fold-containing protein [Jatrophihabitantaceae bacterium]
MHDSAPDSAPPSDVAEPAVVDLLGALAYGELSAFDRLADDARMAPTLDGRAHMSAMAAIEMGHYSVLAQRLVTLGVAPSVAMEPFVAALETYHSLTEPSTWLEGVVKAYVGDGMAADFYREVAEFVDESTRALIREVLADTARAEFAVREVRAAIYAQPTVAGRLALWARRLVGEAISQTQHVLADRDALMLLMMHGTGDLSGVAGLIARITERHEERMAALGLSS